MKNHTTRTVPINARRVDLLAHNKGKKVTNRCRSALVQSVLSSLVLVQGARARALWRLSGHTLLSREMRERESLAAVFLEVELNSGEICRIYKAAG